MKIGGWKTNSVFRRYAITDRRDLAQAIRQLEEHEKKLASVDQKSRPRPRTQPSSFSGHIVTSCEVRSLSTAAETSWLRRYIDSQCKIPQTYNPAARQ